MLKKIVLLAGIVLNIAAAPVFVTQKDEKGRSYESIDNDPIALRVYTLNNGLKVYLTPNNSEPSIVTRIAVGAGSSYDPSDNTGLAHYLEHMMFKGTAQIGALDWEKEKPMLDSIAQLYQAHKRVTNAAEKAFIYEQIDELSQRAAKYVAPNELPSLFKWIGASGTNAYTYLEETVYINTIPSNELENFLKLEAERFKQVVLRLFHTELEAVYEEFNQMQDRDSYRIITAIFASLFPTHPYGTQTTIGKPEHLKNPSMKAIDAYFKKYYVPSNMALILSGDFDYDNAIALAEKYLGTLQNGEDWQKPTLPIEKPIKKPIEKTVYSSGDPSMNLGFRLSGSASQEALLAEVFNQLLVEEAGIFNLNLNYPQKLQSVDADILQAKEYSVHEFSAQPKAGQSLKELKNLVLKEIERVKKGDFDTTILPAVTQKMYLDFYKSLKKNENRAAYLVQSFIQKKDWAHFLEEAQRVQKITAQELINFVKMNYGQNYAVVYKAVGEDKTMVRVKSPDITPIPIQREQHSAFFDAFTTQKPPKPIAPVFVDYSKIQSKKLANGLEMYYNPDTSRFTKDLFSVIFLFDGGKKNDPALSLLFSYADFLGTENASLTEVKKALFKLGLSIDFAVGDDKSYIQLSGVEKNFEAGLLFLEKMIQTLKADEKAYQNVVANILQSRENDKKDPEQILARILSFAIYGENSPLLNLLSKQDLLAQNPTQLTEKMRTIFAYPHRIVYQGNNFENAQKIIEQHHILPEKTATLAAAKTYQEQKSEGKKYFVNYDKVQVFLLFILRDRLVDPAFFAHARLFNQYFGMGLSSIVFQEIREAKALAYRAGAQYQNADEKNHYNTLFAFVNTQADKVPAAEKSMEALFEKLPKNLQQFEQSRQNLLRQIASERIPTEKLFWNLEALKKLGLNYDIRKNIYEQLQTLTWEEFESFFKAIFQDKTINKALLGPEKILAPIIQDAEKLSLEQIFGY